MNDDTESRRYENVRCILNPVRRSTAMHHAVDKPSPNEVKSRDNLQRGATALLKNCGHDRAREMESVENLSHYYLRDFTRSLLAKLTTTIHLP